jgi:predicted dehydrogenase
VTKLERRYADYRELLAAGELDAVVISVPHVFHDEIARDTLDAHVLLEKQAK